MKKILLATAFIMMMVFGANAQGRDGFFSNYDNGYGNRTNDNMNDPDGLINFPNQGINETDNEQAPLGSGLIVLTALGAGYAVYRKKRS